MDEEQTILTAAAFLAVLDGSIHKQVSEEEFQKKYAGFYGERYGSDSVTFGNISVHGGIVITKGFSTKLQVCIEKGCTFQDFIIYGGDFQQDFIISGGDFQQDFIISGGDFQQDFIISGGDFQQDFIIFGGDFQQDFRIFGGDFQQDFIIYGGDFQQDFIIFGGDFQQDFRIYGGDFQQDFRIYGGDFQQDFRIYGGDFQQDFIIYGGDFQKNFTIIGGTFNQISATKKSFHFEYYDFAQGKMVKKNTSGAVIRGTCHIQAQITWCTLGFYFVEELVIEDIITNALGLSNTQMNSLKLKGICNSTIHIQGIRPNAIDCQGFQNSSSLYLTNIAAHTAKNGTLSKWRVDKDTKADADGEWEIEELSVEKEDSRFTITNSDMGNTSFKGVALDSFSHLQIIDSSLHNSRFEGCAIPTNHKKINTNIPVQKGEQGRDTSLFKLYRDVSLAYEARKDTLHRFDYLALAHRHQRRSLPFWKISQKTSLWFNALSNNHGRSWFFPVLWIVGFAAVSFGLYGTLAGLSATTLWSGDYWALLPEYVVPTHKFNFAETFLAQALGIKKEALSMPWYLPALDLFTRLVIGTLIYQAILAFRIFGRR